MPNSHVINAMATAMLFSSVILPIQAQNATETLSLSPAVTTVSTAADSSTTLFADETLQLTDAVLDSVAAQLSDQLGNDSIASLFAFGDNSTVDKRASSSCKTYAGDSAWPSSLIWYAFDLLLGKRLIKTVPIASPCYTNWNDYDASECQYITDEFTDSFLHMDHPTSIMSPFFQGATCMPIDGAPANCTLGGYPSYAVNVSTVAQIQLTVNLARALNLRLVIKNTGHDWAGKSAGAGALSLWTHNLKGLSYISNYASTSYTGAAFKLGSGIQAFELYEAANKYGVTAIGGEGETVGVAGGYLQGGGHSPLGSIYGLAADQALSFEVVTADGRFVTASPDTNSDLYWALRGGGGSAFGVVTSVTVKAWPKVGVTVDTFSFQTSDSLDSETFWAAVRAYFNYFIPFADNGTYGYFSLYAVGDDQYYFGMAPYFAPNMTVAEYTAMIQPFFDDLAALGIEVDNAPVYYDNFYDAWSNAFPLESIGGATGRIASRLFPKANWEDATLLNETFNAIRNTTENGFVFLGFNFKHELHPSNSADSANPAWREVRLHAITAVSWDTGTPAAEILELSNGMTYGAMDQWRAVTPGSGSYLGEADASEPNWQQSFYGSNYDQLLAIKQKYDPNGVFYALHAVGTEGWTVETSDGLPTQNGKLCKV